MTTKNKFILIALACILTSSLLFYLKGYTESSSFSTFCYFIDITGWLIILFCLFGTFLLRDKTKYQKNKLKWLRQTIVKTLLYLSFGGLVVGNITLIDDLSNKRILNILSSQPTKTTIATVTEIESRNTRGGPKSYAIIQYETPDKIIQQSVYNYNDQYLVGQTYELLYSVDHPEMFKIGRQENKITTP